MVIQPYCPITSFSPLSFVFFFFSTFVLRQPVSASHFHKHTPQQQQQHLIDPSPQSIADAQHKRTTPLFSRTSLLILLSFILVLGVVFPWIRSTDSLFSSNPRGSLAKWRSYTLSQTAAFVGKNGTVVVCAVSKPYIPFLNNWLISVSRQKHQDKVLILRLPINLAPRQLPSSWKLEDKMMVAMATDTDAKKMIFASIMFRLN